MLVLDASVVSEWVAPDTSPDSVAMRLLRRLRDAGTPLLAPRLLMQEVANSLLSGVRRGRWTGQDADAAYLDLRVLPIRLADQPQDIDRAWELARRYDNAPVYDMVYVAVAERLQLELITADRALLARVKGLSWVVGLE